MSADVSGRGSALAPNLVSLVRPLLGLALCYVLAGDGESASAVALVLAACVSDFVDGRLARARGLESFTGRLIDNLCDATFLALAFSAMGGAGIWTVADGPIALPEAAAVLPLLAFASAFATYLVRMGVDRRRGTAPARSRFGHSAGIANYGLAIAGGVEALPSIALWSWLLEAGVLGVAMLNAAAVVENLRLMFPRPAGSPTMRP